MEHNSPQLSPTTSDPMLSAAMADLPFKETPPNSALKFHFQYSHGRIFFNYIFFLRIRFSGV